MSHFLLVSMSITHYTREYLEKLHQIFGSFIIEKTIPSLSRILEEPVEYNLRRIREIEIMDLENMMPTFEDTMTMSAVYVKGEGDLRIGILLCMPERDSKKLSAKLLGKSKMSSLTSVGRSSISEIGNILSASILNAISNNGLKVESSVPGFAIDTFRTLIEFVASEIGSKSDRLIIANVDLIGINSGTKLHILLVQDDQEARKLLLHN